MYCIYIKYMYDGILIPGPARMTYDLARFKHPNIRHTTVSERIHAIP